LVDIEEERLVRSLFSDLEVSPEAREIIWAAFSDSTLQKYKAALYLWVRWCIANGTSIKSSEPRHLASCLAWCSAQGKSARQCENVRSAVSTVVGLHTGVHLGTSKMTSLVIKALHKLQPAKPRYSAIWDCDILHRFLDSLGDDRQLADATLAAKLTSLLLLHCFVRFSEMATILLRSVEFPTSNDVSFLVVSKTEQLKQTRIRASVVATATGARRMSTCISEYTRRLRKARFRCSPSTPLLTDLVTGLPYQVDQLRDMSKALMRNAGIDTVRFTAYSLKAAGLSGRAADGESVAELEAAARLSHRSGTLGKFYLKRITKH
jgi:hypothetical protein